MGLLVDLLVNLGIIQPVKQETPLPPEPPVKRYYDYYLLARARFPFEMRDGEPRILGEPLCDYCGHEMITFTEVGLLYVAQCKSCSKSTVLADAGVPLNHFENLMRLDYGRGYLRHFHFAFGPPPPYDSPQRRED